MCMWVTGLGSYFILLNAEPTNKWSPHLLGPRHVSDNALCFGLTWCFDTLYNYEIPIHFIHFNATIAMFCLITTVHSRCLTVSPILVLCVCCPVLFTMDMPPDTNKNGRWTRHIRVDLRSCCHYPFLLVCDWDSMRTNFSQVFIFL